MPSKKDPPVELERMLGSLGSPDDLPDMEMTEEQGKKLSAEIAEAIEGLKTRIPTIKAKGDSDDTMEEVGMAIAAAINEAVAKAGLPIDPVDPLVPERNGRAVATELPDDATLRTGSIDVLADRYVDIALAAHQAQKIGLTHRYDRFVGRLDIIEKALKARIPDGRTALLPFLSDSHPGIRSFVARACRDIPQQ